MPEWFYFLSHARIFLALSPKSNSAGAFFVVSREIRNNGAGTVPPHLRDMTANKMAARYLDADNASKDYKYPHNYPNLWVEQQYLPDEVKDKRWFSPGQEGRERRLWERLKQIVTGG